MRNRLADVFVAMNIAWIIPWLVICFCGVWQKDSDAGAINREVLESVPLSEEHVPVLLDNSIIEMSMEDYLTGVILAEMPGSFHMEAKKSQAVVARTYAMRIVSHSGKHNGMICTDSTCCQAYAAPENYDPWHVEEARQAVMSTNGLVLLYDGELIEATYFSCSGGQTEDAVAVWGTDVPYLQSVESPGEETASVYRDEKKFSKAELERLLEISLSGSPRQWFGNIVYTEGGGVASIRIGTRTWKGTELRSLLGLRSTAFDVKCGDNGLTIITKGYGHRVGMSQYGAQAMALSGKSYDQILLHYYKDTQIVPLHMDSAN